jgi:hypothetical protein
MQKDVDPMAHGQRADEFLLDQIDCADANGQQLRDGMDGRPLRELCGVGRCV